MAFARCPLEPVLGLREVERNAFSETIGLAEVERRIGIALLGERAPDAGGRGCVSFLPGVDTGPHGLGGKRCSSHSGGQDNQQATHNVPGASVSAILRALPSRQQVGCSLKWEMWA